MSVSEAPWLSFFFLYEPLSAMRKRTLAGARRGSEEERHDL